EDGIRDDLVTGVQTCALPILGRNLFVFTLFMRMNSFFFMKDDSRPNFERRLQGKRTMAFSVGISMRRLSVFAFGGGFHASPRAGKTPCTSNESNTYGTPSAPSGELASTTWKCRCGPCEFPELPRRPRTWPRRTFWPGRTRRLFG